MDIMDKFFELLESVVFRVDGTGAITPLNKAATVLIGERPRDQSSLTVLFGESSHARLAAAAAAGSPRTCAIGSSRIKWELLLPDGKDGDILAVGVDWKPASELVDQMTKETLIFKELVMNLAPRFIVDAMMERKAVQPKAYREATIMFIDAIGFAELAAELDPVSLIRRLDYYFSKFDQACAMFGLEKLKTVGDAYMAVSGIPHRKPSHAVDAVLGALQIMSGVRQSTAASTTGGVVLEFRVGMHSGPVISGVLGFEQVHVRHLGRGGERGGHRGVRGEGRARHRVADDPRAHPRFLRRYPAGQGRVPEDRGAALRD